MPCLFCMQSIAAFSPFRLHPWPLYILFNELFNPSLLCILSGLNQPLALQCVLGQACFVQHNLAETTDMTKEARSAARMSPNTTEHIEAIYVHSF
jgi:hypothetical protein